MVTIIPPKPEYNRFEIPDNSGKNKEFEKYVLQNLFPQQYYTLIDPKPGKMLKVKNIHRTDFILHDSITGLEFKIQCKYHHALISNSFRFSENFQENKNISYTGHQTFLVLGLGGSPDSPNEVYLSNFKDCPNQHLLKRHLKGKFISGTQIIRISDMYKQETKRVVLSKKIA